MVPADGINAATCENVDFDTSPFFWAALRQATACLVNLNLGCLTRITMAVEKLSAGFTQALQLYIHSMGSFATGRADDACISLGHYRTCLLLSSK